VFSASASQAYVERIFSVCGDLRDEKNWAELTLEKLNILKT